MTSKEALKQLNNFISREKHINSERNKTINECINTIKQDLERLETLEKQNEELFGICAKQAYIINNKHIDKTFNEELQEENEKLKKVIEIIKNKRVNLNLLFQEPNTLEAYNNYCLPIYKLTQQEYELLNEVLGE